MRLLPFLRGCVSKSGLPSANPCAQLPQPEHSHIRRKTWVFLRPSESEKPIFLCIRTTILSMHMLRAYERVWKAFLPQRPSYQYTAFVLQRLDIRCWSLCDLGTHLLALVSSWQTTRQPIWLTRARATLRLHPNPDPLLCLHQKFRRRGSHIPWRSVTVGSLPGRPSAERQ